MPPEYTEQPFASREPSGARSPDVREGYDDRLNRVLEAATEVIARNGYQRASMRVIAKTAGLSLAGLYHYFDNKDKILFLIQFRTFGSLLSRLRENLHGIEDPLDQLYVMVRSHVGYFAANMAALKVCAHELDSLTGPAYEETLRIRREYYQLSRGVIDRVLDAVPSDGGLDRHVLTMSLFGALNWLYRWYDPEQGRPPNVLADQISRQFLLGVRGDADRPVGSRPAGRDAAADASSTS
jgi:AcrR family transcriptional regulator